MISLPSCPLSPREREILSLIAKGYSDKLMARELHLALPTVKKHTQSAIHKCEAHNRTHAVVIALANGWIAFLKEK